MRRSDLVALDQIDPNFTSDGYLDVEVTRAGLATTFHLVERRFEAPFTKEVGYRYDTSEIERTRFRLDAGDCLLLVAETAGRLVGLLEVEPDAWRNTATIWAIFVDSAWRGQGLGADLLHRAEAWARAQGFRALVLETQTNNLPAIRFYLKHGFEIAALDTRFYTNQDQARREVALFLYKTLDER